MMKIVALLMCVALIAQISAVPVEKPAVAKRQLDGALNIVTGLTGVVGGLVGGLLSGVLKVVDLNRCLVNANTQCTAGQQCLLNVELGGVFCATLGGLGLGNLLGGLGLGRSGRTALHSATGAVSQYTGLAGGLVQGLTGVVGGLLGGILGGALEIVDLSNCLANVNTQCTAAQQCVLNVELGGVFCAALGGLNLGNILGRSGRSVVHSATGAVSQYTGLAGGLVQGLTGVVGGILGGLLGGVLQIVDLSNCLANVNTQCTAAQQCVLNVELGGVFCAALGGLNLGNLLG